MPNECLAGQGVLFFKKVTLYSMHMLENVEERGFLMLFIYPSACIMYICQYVRFVYIIDICVCVYVCV